MVLCLLVLGGGLPACGGAGPLSPGSGRSPLCPVQPLLTVSWVLSSWAWKEQPQGGGGGAPSCADPGTLPAPRGWGHSVVRLSRLPCPSPRPRLRPPLTALCSRCSHLPPRGQEELQGMPQKGWGQPPRRGSAHPTQTPASQRGAHTRPLLRQPSPAPPRMLGCSGPAREPQCAPGAQAWPQA